MPSSKSNCRSFVLLCFLCFSLGKVVTAKVLSIDDSGSDRTGDLRLEGKVLKTKLTGEGYNRVYEMTLKLRLVNNGKSPIIVLKGTYEGEWWLTSTRLMQSQKIIYNSAVLPANSAMSPYWAHLRKALDIDNPPSKLTVTIPPGGSFEFERGTFFPVSALDNQSGELTLSVSVEMWPFNIETGWGKLSFGRRLRHKWESKGTLQLEPLTSEPIGLDASTILKANARFTPSLRLFDHQEEMLALAPLQIPQCGPCKRRHRSLPTV